MRLMYRLMQTICQVGFIYYLHGRVFGRENVPASGGVLLACNHQSFLDPVLAGVGLTRECHFMARDSLFRQPQFRRLITFLNSFPVRRASADMTAMKEAIRRLRAGAALVIFPEGTRTKDGSIGPLLPGPVLLAKRAGVPIVPVFVSGAFESWPRNRPLPRPGYVTVRYGEPLTVEQVEAWPEQRIIDELRERMLTLAAHRSRNQE